MSHLEHVATNLLKLHFSPLELEGQLDLVPLRSIDASHWTMVRDKTEAGKVQSWDWCSRTDQMLTQSTESRARF